MREASRGDGEWFELGFMLKASDAISLMVPAHPIMVILGKCFLEVVLCGVDRMDEEGESSGFASTPSNIDRSKVHTVKPLRSLVPVFVYPPADASSSYLSGQGPPFLYAPPSGPFPQGYAPFYPFCLPPQHQQAYQHNVRNAAGASNPGGPSEFNYPVHSSKKDAWHDMSEYLHRPVDEKHPSIPQRPQTQHATLASPLIKRHP
ncbi:Histone-lysine N-methyltransferase, H3 lysine-9 specific SUVH1-like protein [Drosera capensis]